MKPSLHYIHVYFVLSPSTEFNLSVLYRIPKSDRERFTSVQKKSEFLDKRKLSIIFQSFLH